MWQSLPSEKERLLAGAEVPVNCHLVIRNFKFVMCELASCPCTLTTLMIHVPAFLTTRCALSLPYHSGCGHRGRA